MPAVSRKSDLSTAGDICVTYSPNVYANGLNVARQGDLYTGPPSPGTVVTGSPNVFANSLQVARIGDPLTDGDAVATGSGNVLAN